MIFLFVVVLDYCATAAAWLTAATTDCSSRWANYTLLHDTVKTLLDICSHQIQSQVHMCELKQISTQEKKCHNIFIK